MDEMHTNLSLVFVTAPILWFTLMASIPFDHPAPKHERHWRSIIQNNGARGLSPLGICA